MKIVFADSKPELFKAHIAKLEQELSAKVITVTLCKEANRVLDGDSEVAMVISGEVLGDGSCEQIYQNIFDGNNKIPFIYFGVDSYETNPAFNTFLQDHVGNGFIEKSATPEIFSKYVVDKLSACSDSEDGKKTVVDDELPSYVPVKTSLVLKLNRANHCDVYVKISNTKFVKVINENESFDDDDVHKFEKRGIQRLYVRAEDYKSFIQSCTTTYEEQLEKASGESEEKVVEIQVDIQKQAQHQLLNVGVNPQTMKLTQVTVDATIAMMDKNTDLKDLMGKVKGSNSYLFSHSMLVAYISTAMGRNLSWDSKDTKVKLALAAFMHDIALTDDALAKIRTLDEAEKLKISKEDIETIGSHPIKGAQLVKKLKGFPSDIDTIIVQHHERPNGNGFPRGLTANYISPLAAVFIVAHEFVDMIFGKESPSKEEIKSIVEKLTETFSKGHFKKAMDALVGILD